MKKTKFNFPDLDFEDAEHFDDDELKQILLDAAEDMVIGGQLTPAEYRTCVDYIDLWILHIKHTKH